MKHLVTMAERSGATATRTEMVSWQHFDDPTTRRDVGAKESVHVQKMQKMVG